MSSSASSSNSASTVKVAVGCAVATYLAFRGSRMLTAPPLLEQFSKTIEDERSTEKDEGAKIRVNLNDKPLEQVCKEFLPGFDGTITTWALFKSTAKKFASNDFHGQLQADNKTWSWETYGSVLSDVECLGRGMERLGLLTYAKNDNTMRVFGLFGPNCSNWSKCEYASVSRSATTVTFYATLTLEGVAHVINLTGVESIACLSKDCAIKCLSVKTQGAEFKASSVKNIIVPQEYGDDVEALANSVGVRIITMDEIRLAGRDPNDLPPKEPTIDSIFTFCFTSGSTGMPKGALITHKSLVANVAATAATVEVVPVLRHGNERYLSFLPLAHQFERVVQTMLIAWGAKIGYSRGDPALIMEDVALLRPTFFSTVPRLLNRLYDGIRTKVNATGGVKAKLFHLAMESKLYDLEKYRHWSHPIWDRIVFSKLKKQLGLGDCNVIVTGSAPVAPRVLDFLRCVLSCRVVEGYGQTEFTCSATVAHPWHVGGPSERLSHVGSPICTAQVKLQSVPEMHYLVSDRLHDGKIPCIGRGEVLLRGPSTMSGYFQMREKTAQTIDSDGWLHTGDVGIWLPNGCLSIVDRANNIFKTALGEYVQPDKIERAMARVPIIATSFLFGTTLNTKLVAIVVLNIEALPHWCSSNGISNANDLQAIKVKLTEQVRETCKQVGLAGFEIPQALNLQTKPFTVESGVLTATAKLVRGRAKEVFHNELIALYKEVGEDVKL